MNIFKKLFGSTANADNNSGRKKLDIEKLLASHDINSCIIEIDNFVCELCAWGDDIDKLTTEQKNFYYNQNLEREINNGGFNQFFFNSAGNFAHETIDSLKAIKAEKTANILQKAIDQFPDKIVPENKDERQEVLEAIDETADDIWEELDQKFFIYEDDLNALNIEYIRQHIAKF